MASDEQLSVEVAYACPDTQVIIPVEVPRGATLEDAIRRSNILEEFPDIDLGRNKVGVFGKLRKLNEVVRPGDRIEIYRPLIADPKEVRRRRAAEGKQMRKGVGADQEGREI